MIDLLIRGGHVVAADTEGALDVGISGEEIAFVAPAGSVEAESGRTIDATGLLVFPGGVEAHAHIHEPMHRGWTRGEEVWLQSPEGATRAALFGGTTTVVSFAFMDVHVEAQEFDAAVAVEHRWAIFAARSHADFAFHPVFTGTPTDATMASIADAVADGTTTFKFFTTDLTTTQAGIRLDYGSARELLAQCARLGAMAMVHAEDDDLIKYMEAKLRREGRAQLRNVHEVHTNVGEEIAVRTVARLAEEEGAALYVAHVCGRGALAAIAERRAAGAPVYGEALHNCMCFSLEDYDRPDGAKFHIGMGLRPREDGEALWSGLADGRLSTLATDEYTTSYAVKMAGSDIESTPAVTSASRRAASSASPRAPSGTGSRCGASSTCSRRIRRASPGSTRARARSRPAATRTSCRGTRTRSGRSRSATSTTRALQPLGRLARPRLAGNDDPARRDRRRQGPPAEPARRRPVRQAQARPRRPRQSSILRALSGDAVRNG